MFYTSKRWFSRQISDPSKVTSHKNSYWKILFTKLVRFEMYCFFFTGWQRSRHVWLNPPQKNVLHQKNVTVFLGEPLLFLPGGRGFNLPEHGCDQELLWLGVLVASVSTNPPTVGHLDRGSPPFLGGETSNYLLFSPWNLGEMSHSDYKTNFWKGLKHVETTN